MNILRRQAVKLRLAVTALAAAGAVVATAPAWATEITVDNVEVPYSETVSITGTVDGNAINETGQIAGEIDLTVHDTGQLSSQDFVLPVWCVDLFHDIYIGGSGYVFTVNNPLSTNNTVSNAGDPLTSAQISEITSLVVYGSQLLALSPSALLAQTGMSQSVFSAAVQAAIWEVEYTNPAYNSALTVSDAGVFSQSDLTTIETNANTYFLTANSGAHQIDTTGSIQDQAYDPKFLVPEPGTLPVFVAGLFGLGAVLLRRKAILRTRAA